MNNLRPCLGWCPVHLLMPDVLHMNIEDVHVGATFERNIGDIAKTLGQVIRAAECAVRRPRHPCE